MDAQTAEGLRADIFSILEELFKPTFVDFPDIECVYFLYAKSQRLLKIGYTKNPLKRFLAIRRNVPFALELLAIHPGGRALERRYHHRNKPLKVKGEWYRCSSESAEGLRKLREKYWQEWNRLAMHFPERPLVQEPRQ